MLEEIKLARRISQIILEHKIKEPLQVMEKERDLIVTQAEEIKLLKIRIVLKLRVCNPRDKTRSALRQNNTEKSDYLAV